MTDRKSLEPLEAPDDLSTDAAWEAVLEALRATMQTGLPREALRARVATELATISEWARLSVAPARAVPVPRGRRDRGRVTIWPDERPKAVPLQICFDYALWQALERPAFLRIERRDNIIHLVPSAARGGHEVSRRDGGTMRLRCSQGEIGALEAGVYTASVVEGAIVIGAVVE